jgi:hypothetical protein
MRVVVVTIICAATIGDLWIVSRLVTYAFLVERPPILDRERSEVRKLALADDPQPRLYAPGQNLPNLLGVASTPVYLGLGPAEYYDPKLTMPVLPESSEETVPLPAAAGQVEWLGRAGVTHVLSHEPLDPADWPVALRFAGVDRLLNPAWARPEPVYLYRLEGTRGRATFVEPRPSGDVNVTEYSANRVVLESDCPQPASIVLTDLMYPGWRVSVDGQTAEAVRVEGMYRGVELPPGRHTVVWTYRPASVHWGGAISAATLLMIVIGALARRRCQRRVPIMPST